MAILDALTILSSAQAITVTAASSNVYDTAGLGVGSPVTNIIGLPTASSGGVSFGNDLGGGGPNAEGPQLQTIVGTTFTAGGAGTLTIQLQAASDTSNTGTPGTYQTIAQTDAYALATLVAGARLTPSWSVPGRYAGSNFPRFYRLNYVVATGPMLTGTISAQLVTGQQDSPTYPGNF